jgi:hypothetical protein
MDLMAVMDPRMLSSMRSRFVASIFVLLFAVGCKNPAFQAMKELRRGMTRVEIPTFLIHLS